MTGVLAIATVVLAVATFWTSKLARTDADVQHRQALSGALTCNELILEFHASEKTSVRYAGGAFKNIGNGPVVNASLTLKLLTRSEIAVKWNLGSYSSGEEREPAKLEERYLLAVPLAQSDWSGATLMLEYVHIFSKPQRTEFTVEALFQPAVGSLHRVAFQPTYISGFERVQHT